SLLFLVLLERSGVHRALPSFPTRRSSDLTCMIGGALIFLVGAFGLLRLRDFYARLSGVGIAAGLGTSLLLLGLLLHYPTPVNTRSEEHTSELQSRFDLVCRLLLEKKKKSY